MVVWGWISPGIRRGVEVDVHQFDRLVIDEDPVHDHAAHENAGCDQDPSGGVSVDGRGQSVEISGEPLDDGWQLEDEKVSGRRCTIGGAVWFELAVERLEERIGHPHAATRLVHAVEGSVRWQACNEETCGLPQRQRFAFQIPAAPAVAPDMGPVPSPGVPQMNGDSHFRTMQQRHERDQTTSDPTLPYNPL